MALNAMKKFKYKFKRARIKIFSWEYWPMWLVYFPASFYYIFLAIKARSFFFFSASNPTIENGGMLYESKWKIFRLIPKEFYPDTIYIEELESFDSIVGKFNNSNFKFPVIAKPDVGGRGFGVKIIYTLNDLEDYRNLVKVPFLIQAYVEYPLELSVFYYRNPSEDAGKIISLTGKELLAITGDGHSSIDSLIENNDRAFLQYEKLGTDSKIDLHQILSKGEKRTLVPYGNHVLGCTFLDFTPKIDSELTTTFDLISKRIDGFYFGRYDIRCKNLEDLKKGKNMAILELNGAGAEPAHIYDPNFSYFKAQQVLINYFECMYKASSENHKHGIPYMSYSDFKIARKLDKAYKLKIKV